MRAAAVAVALALVVLACSPEEPSGPARPLVYVSGLDDHLLPARSTVPVHSAPEGPVIAEVPVDVLAWARGSRGEWVEVEVAEGASQRGWVADYYLRGELHVVSSEAPHCPVPAVRALGDPPDQGLDPSTRVELVDLQSHQGRWWVQVRSLGTGEEWWVERPTLSEVPGPRVVGSDPDAPCEEILGGDGH